MQSDVCQTVTLMVVEGLEHGNQRRAALCGPIEATNSLKRCWHTGWRQCISW